MVQLGRDGKNETRVTRDIQHDNPSLRRTDELADFLSQLYNRDVSGAHAVTVIRFSAIRNS